MFCLTCALAILRSDIAALMMAAMSGNSQNAWIDTRGTGSICPIGRSVGAAPSIPLLAYCALMVNQFPLVGRSPPMGVRMAFCPIGARILAVADGLDGPGAHGDIGWAQRARL